MRRHLALLCFSIVVIVPTVAAMKYIISENSVECPDKTSYCPEGTTCCALGSEGRADEYGCCPMQNAVCCADHRHCCPQNTVCHVEVGTCEQNGLSTPMRAKTAARRKNYDRHRSHLVAALTVSQARPLNLNLRDDFGEMEEMTVDTRYRTSDASHRNPDEEKTRERINQFLPTQKLSSFKRVIGAAGGAANDAPVPCPDHKSLCPPHTTCCPLDAVDSAAAGSEATATYGCCPSPSAVCCDDHIHCCPHGSTCDTQAETCVHGDSGVQTQLLKKSKAAKRVRKPAVETKTAWLECAADTVDSQQQGNSDSTACPSGFICCADEEGSGFCCPHADGVCCANSRSCCPGGFRCSPWGRCVTALKSVTKNTKISFFGRISAASSDQLAQPTTLSKRDDATICADGSACAPHSTCCAVRSALTDRVEAYRCCELSRAICCGASADFCCPRGYACASARRCERAGSFLDLIN